jgi:hypothetical protein
MTWFGTSSRPDPAGGGGWPGRKFVTRGSQCPSPLAGEVAAPAAGGGFENEQPIQLLRTCANSVRVLDRPAGDRAPRVESDEFSTRETSILA